MRNKSLRLAPYILYSTQEANCVLHTVFLNNTWYDLFIVTSFKIRFGSLKYENKTGLVVERQIWVKRCVATTVSNEYIKFLLTRKHFVSTRIHLWTSVSCLWRYIGFILPLLYTNIKGKDCIPKIDTRTDYVQSA